ncbi:aquaporin-11 [Tachysurus fulvidraco]|uniref:aquaporin-11 n=1 Tax=Tachysurus fulvidraco TaxID=1234273 RepID=UPI000F4E3634|nr:aquaporin-11 [Tachysurus fulvidraco]
MSVVSVSLCVLGGIVIVCEIVRRAIPSLFSGNRRDCGIYTAEIISTVQLCACAHELKLLSEDAPEIALSLTYVVSVIHALTFRGATGNPNATLERYWCNSLDGACALRRTACQFAASVAASLAMRRTWAFGFSDLHARHERAGFTCASPIANVHLLQAVTVELACAFVVHVAVTLTRGVEEKYRVHAVAAVITTVVYAGGSTTGAVFNPALAFSAQFPCTGSTFAKNGLVYWLGPVLGMACSLLLFNKVGMAFTTKSPPHKDQNLHAVKKRKKRN